MIRRKVGTLRFFFLIYIVLCFLQLDGMSRLPLEVLTAISNKVRYENSSYAHALSESNALDLVSKSFHQIHRERLKNQHQKEVDAAQLITRYALPTTFKDLALLKRGCNILALKSIVSIDTLSFEDKQSMIYSFFTAAKCRHAKKAHAMLKNFCGDTAAHFSDQ